MVNKSLGLIEVVGFPAAMAAADAAVKAANVKLIGYELTKGGGLVLVKLCGDVGAVTAGVQAGSMAASKVSKVWATHIIPRPHQQLVGILESQETVAAKKQPKLIPVIENENEMIAEAEADPQPELPNEIEIETTIEAIEVIPTPPSEASQNSSEGDSMIVMSPQVKKQADLCNLCNDPACHRRKGDPKITCIYYGKNTLK